MKPNVNVQRAAAAIDRSARTGLYGFLFIILAAVFATSLLAQTKKNTQYDPDPDPDDFVMMDKGAALDKVSLQKNFIYPDEAKKGGITGTVLVHVMIDKNGKVTRWIVREAVHPLLDSAAVNAVRNASYTAAVYEGRAIKTWMSIPITFRLGKKAQQQQQDDEDSDGYTKPKYDKQALKDEVRYPDEARNANMQCDVKVEVWLTKTGEITELRDMSPCPKILLDELKRAIRTLKFTPAIRDGKPAEDHILISVTFPPKP
ncbi:MAG: TonB family protein [Candidatus Kapabacteria bacterium]|nr:TonB family protein [Candidatus Kapabacteria bacterium]